MELMRAETVTMDFGGVRAVNNVDFAVRHGQIMGIIGPNGAGKTTFFNMMTGFYRPTAGRFFLEGEDITTWSKHRIVQAGVARTFQNIRLFGNMSVIENVLVGEHTNLKSTLLGALFRSAAQKQDEARAYNKAEELLDFVGLLDRKSEYAANLSYGKQRRLELARALATEPKLLLLDEPTAGMNTSEAISVLDLIHTIRDTWDISIVLIEHNMQVMMGTAEWIIALEAGTKIAEGTPKEIQYNEKVIKAYLGEDD